MYIVTGMIQLAKGCGSWSATNIPEVTKFVKNFTLDLGGVDGSHLSRLGNDVKKSAVQSCSKKNGIHGCSGPSF